MMQLQMAAMGTDCLLLVHGAEDDPVAREALARAARQVREYEDRFSRFRPDSELSRLNESPQERVPVGSELGDLLARSLAYARLSGGLFDPVVLEDLLVLGYDRTFEEVGARAQKKVSLLDTPRFRWRDLRVDRTHHEVARPRGARVDLGGIAKGAAVDAAMVELSRYPGALVDIGGDIRVQGEPADADFWIIAVEDGQSDDGALGYIRLRDGAVATSSLRKRRWVHNGETVHHIIDPRSGESARSNVLQCSVIADTAEHAEVTAKVGFIRGPGLLHECSELGRALGVRGIAWLTLDGVYRRTQGWRKHELVG
jgi:thiamine biosynthesis lipoprotein